MEEELNKRITETQRDQLINRINQLYDEGVIRIRDWMAMYDIMLEACKRDKAETMEKYIEECLKPEGGDAE